MNDVKLKQSNGQMNSNILNAHKEFDPLARNVENRQSNVSKRGRDSFFSSNIHSFIYFLISIL